MLPNYEKQAQKHIPYLVPLLVFKQVLRDKTPGPREPTRPRRFLGEWRGLWLPGQPEALPDLLEVRGVLLRECRFVGGEFVDGEDRIRGAHRDAVAAVDALVGIDEQLRHRVCAGLIARGMNRVSGTLRRAQKILHTCIGNYIRHGLAHFQGMGRLISAGDLLPARSLISGNPIPEYRRIAAWSVTPVTPLWADQRYGVRGEQMHSPASSSIRCLLRMDWIGVPNGIRTCVAAGNRRSPGPLDDRDA